GAHGGRGAMVAPRSVAGSTQEGGTHRGRAQHSAEELPDDSTTRTDERLRPSPGARSPIGRGRQGAKRAASEHQFRSNPPTPTGGPDGGNTSPGTTATASPHPAGVAGRGLRLSRVPCSRAPSFLRGLCQTPARPHTPAPPPA